MPNRVLAFVRRALRGFDEYPAPPPIVREAPGGYALFMDENETTVLYAKPWAFTGVPIDDRTNRSEWLIDGHLFTASRREGSNWIFRRTAT